MRKDNPGKYISRSALEDISTAIGENSGSEVFFIGKTDPDLIIQEVEAHAFGGSHSVPVLMRLVEYGDVVLHNHPGGDLEPSEADVRAASALGDLGVGSYIIDNEVENLHVLVKAFGEEGIKPLSTEEVLNYFTPGGKIAENLSGFEFRPQQVDMTELVVRSLNEDRLSVVEAGTGVGKSLSYIVPSALWSLQNKQRVVISTNTINLQEQLIHKDLPFLKNRAGIDFTAELMKGRRNYLCLRRLEMLHGEPTWLDSDQEQEIIETIRQWAEKSTDGSLSDLNIRPPREIWDRVACEADTCLRIRCKHYENCFFYRARRRAARADILVVNHHLVMADLALRMGTNNYSAAAVLPPFKRIVFDEAHNVEQVATNYFTMSAGRRGIVYNLGRLVSRSRDKSEKGLLFHLARKIFELKKKNKSHLLETALERIRNELIPEVHNAGSAVDAEFSHLNQFLIMFLQDNDMEDEGLVKLRITERIRETPFWQEAVSNFVGSATSALFRLTSRIKDMKVEMQNLPEKIKDEIRENVVEISAVGERIEYTASNLRFFMQEDEEYCRWIEYAPAIPHRGSYVNLHAAPIDIRENMRRAVYEVCNTVIMTSATLTVQDRFDYILEQLGLEEDIENPSRRSPARQPIPERLLTLQLGTPFDYDRQSFVAVATDVPSPTDRKFSRALESLIMKSVHISSGGAMILFTSYRLMDRIFKKLEPLIREMGYDCLCQGKESRHRLLARFIKDRDAVLFATASFWEGVDVKGESLRCLVLTRLPFRVPTEPILEARAEALKKLGRDPFRELDLPAAVIRFKQGFGRLIRSKTDRGAVLIFDRRVATKYYGQVFLRSLPTGKIHRAPARQIFKDMKEFFET